ncbi:G-protein coupled receptor Mth2-like [Elysia marginata]|uniref:G-protein coupled receptor Mth2-like n=1 Tax=Elysia marginata TaxID=1093978 RepID=A0AAV4JBM4_9GAST|nr:G-protein coupled receptor Mth2-like [Elysia marginata]
MLSISEESNSTFTLWNITDVIQGVQSSGNDTRVKVNLPSQGSGNIQVTLISAQDTKCQAKIYSCKNRCGSQPRTACSCHYTCEIYGNCCEDYADICSKHPLFVESVDPEKREAVDDIINSRSASVVCLGGSLVINSCSSNFDDFRLAEMKSHVEAHKDSPDYRWVYQYMSLLQAKDFVSRCLQPSVVEADYLGENPVSAIPAGLHFRNFYCAVCNGFSSLEFWLGFSVCSQRDVLEGEATLGPCSKPMAYLPRTGNPNSCFTDSQLVRSGNGGDISLGMGVSGIGEEENSTLIRSDHNSSAMRNETSLWTMPIGVNLTAFGISNSWSNNTSDVDVMNVSHAPRQSKSESELASLSELCEAITSYVSVSPDSGEVFKNIYCYRLLRRRDASIQEMCEPPVRRLPLVMQGHYKTFWPSILYVDLGPDEGLIKNMSETMQSSGMELSRGSKLYLEVEEFAETDFTYKLLGQESLPTCDTATSLIVEGKCLKMAFFLHVFVKFNFERSSLIKGNYKDSAKTYTRFVSDVMTSRFSPRFFCEAIHETTNEISKLEHTGEVPLRCVEIPLPPTNADSNANLIIDQALVDNEEEEELEDQPQTVNGQPVTDARVRRYLDFATQGFHTIHAGNDVMKLPGRVTIRLCLTDMYWAVTPHVSHQYHDYCASYKLRWYAQANIDGVVGEISLEGIITIICCVLSDIGLLVRLALQQVVPFYKTYPAKVQFSLCLTLLLAYTMFLLGGIVDEGSKACRIISTITHLAFLSALFWMNVTAFEIWRTFRHWRNQVVSRGRTSLVLSAMYAVGIPLAIVITALVVEQMYPWSEFSPNYGEYFCWLNGSMAVAMFFVMPCSAICLMNAIFVGLTLRGLRRQRTSISEFKKSNTVTAITDTTIVVKIILLVGITWLLGLLAAMVNNQVGFTQWLLSFCFHITD